jgi:hypothetical protein
MLRSAGYFGQHRGRDARPLPPPGIGPIQSAVDIKDGDNPDQDRKQHPVLDVNAKNIESVKQHDEAPFARWSIQTICRT